MSVVRAAALFAVAAGATGVFGWWWTMGEEQTFAVANERPHEVVVWGSLSACEAAVMYEEDRVTFTAAKAASNASYSYRHAQFEDGLKCLYFGEGYRLLLAAPYRENETYVIGSQLNEVGVLPDSLPVRDLSWIFRAAVADLWAFAVASVLGLMSLLLFLIAFVRRLRRERGLLVYHPIR